MKWNNNIYLYSIMFLLGALTSYILSQYKYFEIKNELDIPNLLISIISLFIGLFIATTLQKKFNRNQNQHTYLLNKFDKLWQSFNNFVLIVDSSNEIELSSIKSFIKEVVHPINSLKNIFQSFNIKSNSIVKLEEKIDDIEKYISDIEETNDNTVNISNHKMFLSNKIDEIQKLFRATLNDIHNL